MTVVKSFYWVGQSEEQILTNVDDVPPRHRTPNVNKGEYAEHSYELLEPRLAKMALDPMIDDFVMV